MLGLGNNLKLQYDVFGQNSGASLEFLFSKNKAIAPLIGPASIAFTRSSAAWYFNSAGVFTQAASNEPRFDHDPSTIEFQNLLTYSQQFDNAAWTKSGSSISANAYIAPDGTLTADKLVENSATSTHSISQLITKSSATAITYTKSIYAKAVERSSLQVSLEGSTSGNATVTFDLSAGTAGATSTSGFTSASASIQSIGGGWYRCILTATTNTDTGVYSTVYLKNSGGSNNYAGDGSSGLFIWGDQVNTGSSALTYKQTVTTTLTQYTSRGLLIEEQRTNLILNSDAIDNATWTKTRSSISANSVTSPDGTSSADKLVEDTTATNNHYTFQTIAISTTTTYTWTVFAKAGERTWLGLSAYDGSSHITFFNLSSGTIGTNGAGNTASITSVGNGWYRCTITRTTSGTTTGAIECYLSTADNTISYTGDGASGLYLWGAQIEAGPFASSYMPTTGSTTTRQGDVAVISNLTGWYNSSAGSLLVEGIAEGSGNTSKWPWIVSFDDGTGNNQIGFYFDDPGTDKLIVQVDSGGVSQATLTPSTAITVGTSFKAAMRYGTNDFASSFNAGTVQTDTSGSVPTVTRMLIGGGDFPWQGWIKRVAYFPRSLTNTELQQYTT